MSSPPPIPEGGAPAARTPPDADALRAKRRMYLRRRIVAGAVACAVLAGAVWGTVSLISLVTRPETVVSNAAISPAGTTPDILVRDRRQFPMRGALGNIATSRACTLLTRPQIANAFDRPQVSHPFATYPFCQWFIGRDTYLALGIRPATPIADVRRATSVVEEAPGLAADAFFGSDRYLYFGDARTTYWLQYERVGEFTGIQDRQLEQLARVVLAAAPTPPSRQKPPGLATDPQPSPAPPVPAASAAAPLRIWFGGDSLAAGPSWAFFELTRDDPRLAVVPEYQVGTGLVRDDYFDWTRHAAGVMASLNPDVAVYMAGANDDQELDVGGRYRAVGDPAWTKEYRRRVGAMMDVMTEGGRRVIWVGMPPMQNPTLDHGMRAVNAAYAAEANERRPLVTYVDLYALLGGEGGAGYTDSMVFHGARQIVRLTDGIHLNGVGSTVAADAILRELRALQER